MFHLSTSNVFKYDDVNQYFLVKMLITSLINEYVHLLWHNIYGLSLQKRAKSTIYSTFLIRQHLYKALL